MRREADFKAQDGLIEVERETDESRACGNGPHGARSMPNLLSVHVQVCEVDEDLWIARCMTDDGKPCVIDRRSAVSVSAMHEGMRLRVRMTRGGLIKYLEEDEPKFGDE